MEETIGRVELFIVDVSDKTDWAFIEVETAAGFVGIGEATLYGQEDTLHALTGEFGKKLVGQPLSAIDNLVDETQEERARAPRAVVSALDQAHWDIKAKKAQLPVYELLGGAQRQTVPIYANVNRRCRDRSPEGFAANACDAVGAGFSHVKIAPFDGLQPQGGPDDNQLFDAGMDRIQATIDAVGDDVQVLVDCHWRLDLEQSQELLKQAAVMRLFWVECPLIEDPDDLSNLEPLRSLKESLGVRMAGAEQGTNLTYFKKFIDGGIYDVIMPDVKYAGGPSELMRIAEIANAAGVDFSPHNPSGPICHLASLHVSAAIPNMLLLEHQFDESPLFMELYPGAVPAIENGQSHLPTGPGIGVRYEVETEAV